MGRPEARAGFFGGGNRLGYGQRRVRPAEPTQERSKEVAAFERLRVRWPERRARFHGGDVRSNQRQGFTRPANAAEDAAHQSTRSKRGQRVLPDSAAPEADRMLDC